MTNQPTLPSLPVTPNDGDTPGPPSVNFGVRIINERTVRDVGSDHFVLSISDGRATISGSPGGHYNSRTFTVFEEDIPELVALLQESVKA